MRVAGDTLQAIADTLNADAVPMLGGGTHGRPSSVRSAAGYRRARPRHKPAQLPVFACRAAQRRDATCRRRPLLSKCRDLRLFQGEIVRKILPGTCATAWEPLESFPRALKRATRRRDVASEQRHFKFPARIAEGGREMRTVPAAPKRLACERGQTTAAHRILIAVIAPAAVVVAITVGSNTDHVFESASRHPEPA